MKKTCSRSWIKYYPIKDARPIPEAISMYHYGTVEEALSRLALESTIGMFMKLALGTTPFVNLDDIIPLCYGMEKELDTRLKELGMHLKMRELSPAERMEVTYPFPGQYLLGTQAEKEQKPEKGKSFLYTITSRDMHYFGWSNTPDFKDRLRRGNRTDGANEYKRITEARAKLDGTRAPTVTSSLLAKCDVTDNTQIEAKMIIAGYVAYLLGLRNPLRKLPSGRGYSTNKCVSLSLVDSDSWSDICQFVKLFWGVEPILAKFDKDRGEMPNFIADSENYSDDKVENSEDEDYNPDEDEHNPEAGSSSSGDHSTDSNSDESD
ncbi:uncharacterized protein LOC110848500 isoform X1 [Folsomia candida]|uniref:uncharacterized protein LOC110848500 isoform X1 n=1 Tax=Folsomia candida TaxID=158441 RepID=UPI0016052CAC|nr:uncharacterized protein LOC110848500 isoform X1 [Folsomia candida]